MKRQAVHPFFKKRDRFTYISTNSSAHKLSLSARPLHAKARSKKRTTKNFSFKQALPSNQWQTDNNTWFGKMFQYSFLLFFLTEHKHVCNSTIRFTDHLSSLLFFFFYLLPPFYSLSLGSLMPQKWSISVQEERKGGSRLDLICHVINTAISCYINWLLGNVLLKREKKTLF